MQQQFLNVIDRDEAERRFHAALRLSPLGEQTVQLSECLGCILARDVVSSTNVPSFDRSNYDGYAACAADTFGAQEESPKLLRLLDERLDSAVVPECEVAPGTAVAIATGGMIPRGADAVVMVEDCDVVGPDDQPELIVRRAVYPGFGITYTATDMSAGETVLRAGQVLTSRETGVLAAIGQTSVVVWRKPRVAILSTGDEIIPPGNAMQPGLVYDSNARILADAVRELGGTPVELGIVRDQLGELRHHLGRALAESDVVLLSGGTSKGHGDLCYHVVEELTEPGIVAHGVALKPGKPLCLAVNRGKPVVVLPGFPTSAIFTFHEFVAPVLRAYAGRSPDHRATVPAKLAYKVNSEVGRTEYLLVTLVEDAGERPGSSPAVAYPMGKGSGSVTAFSHADGFITVDRHQEMIEAGRTVEVQLLGQETRVADLIVIGSHCVGLDYLLGELQRAGWRTKFLAVGSTAGLQAAQRGECDVAGVHLLDPKTGRYNRPYLTLDLELIEGYRRRQGIVFRAGDERFAGSSPLEIVARVRNDPSCVMVNRNAGSGTRMLIDRLLAQAAGDAMPAGYAIQVNSHHAVAAAVCQGRADWGVAIETVVKAPANLRLSGGAGDVRLSLLPLEDERFDFVVPVRRRHRAAVEALVHLLSQRKIQRHLQELGVIFSA